MRRRFRVARAAPDRAQYGSIGRSPSSSTRTGPRARRTPLSKRSGVPGSRSPVGFTAGDLVMACGNFQDGLVDGTLAHRANQRLDVAVAALTGATVREQEAWSRP